MTTTKSAQQPTSQQTKGCAHNHAQVHNHADGRNHSQGHSHSHDHSHEHNHGNLPIVLYGIGLILYLVALLFVKNELLENSLFVVTILTAGYHVIVEGISETVSDTLSQKKFVPNVHILMTLAAAGAAAIGDFDEGALLILIFAGAHFLEDYAEGKSKREITKLLKLNPTEARLIQADGATKLVDVSVLKIGDELKVLPGDQIPTDGVILSGGTAVDESSITGESMPKEKTVMDEVFGSTMNGNGTFTMRVTKDSQDTVFAKIVEMVSQAQSNMSKTATKIKQLEPVYVTAVLIIVPIFILAAPFVFGWSWQESIYRGMVLLISASPCALAASAVPATLSGISNLAKRGVLFKGGSYLSNLATIKAVAFDKTGTLTEGKPSVTDTYFVDETKKVDWLNIVVHMEKESNHPLATAMLEAFTETKALHLDVTNEIGKGLVTTFEGKHYRLGKIEADVSLPQVIKERNNAWMEQGKTVVSLTEDAKIVGLIALMDVPNKASAGVIEYLRSQGIQTTMITGDAKVTGEAVAKELNIDKVQANVLPENKSFIISELQKDAGPTVMLGDGINDAPALVQADIGFAMGDGTDIAIDIADAVIMNNDLTKFSYAHRVSKKLAAVVWQNIFFSMFIVVLLVVLNILGKMDIGIGVLAHEGSTLIVILNGLRLLVPLKEN
ncbi:heavy metal translocating P-type ATPase [Candidatus Enterococcus huntleyi]|uniref:heavy metal translocating P-type ATPase n=1 Tax=Candidatus Enterococcus huntleyi TaxID=1857217 RepID=UPI00137AA2DE|nr:heavy metal translocating P-type ATPase [Enterococcus sp. JM4C]